MVEQKLPPEVWAIIFQTLNHATRRVVKGVCWAWKDIVDTNFLKYRVGLCNENCHQVLQSTVQFEKMEILNLTDELDPILENAVKSSLIQINHKSPKCIVFKGRCQKSCSSLVPTDSNTNGNEAVDYLSPKNLDIIFGGGLRDTESLLFERNSLKLLRVFPNQGKLTKRKQSRCRQSNGGCNNNNKSEDEKESCSSSSSASVENVEQRNWTFTNLQYLLMDGESGVSKLERLVFERITSVKIPILRKVQLCWLVQADQQENEKTYLMFYQLLVHHRHTLKDVTLFHVFTRGNILKKGSEVLPKKQMVKLRDELSKLQLDKLIIQFDRYEGFRIFTLGHHLVSCQNKLKTLGVSMRANFEYNVNQIRQAIEKNKNTLKEFLVESREKVNGKELQAAVCSCHHLEFLKMINIQLQEFSSNLPSRLTKINLSGHLNAHENLGYIFQLKHLENFRYLDIQEYNLIEQSRISSHLEKLRALGPQLKYLLFHAKNIPFDQFCQRTGGGGDNNEQLFKAGRATFVRRWYFPTKVIYFKDLPYLSLPNNI